MRSFFLALCVCVLWVSAAYAGAVEAISVEGNQRIEQATVRSYLTFKEGSDINQEKIDESLKALFKTGLFADVRITTSGNNVLVKVEENPIINEVSFEGNKRIEDGDLEKEIRLKPRAVYTKAKVQSEVTRLLSVYQKKGRFNVMIVPKIEQLDQNRVNLIFAINEGSKAKIAKVFFVGNNAFSDRKLEKAIETKRSVWYRFFSGDDTYDPDRLAFDQELLRKFYISRGYADFKVVSAIAEIVPEKEAYYLTFTLDEGRLYQFGDINVQNRVKNVSTEALQEHVKTVQGSTFDAGLIEKSVEDMVNYLSDNGYAFVEIDPQFKRNPETNTIGIDYIIKEGPKVYVENINIRGNVRTMDKVVRREFRFGEGDPYNAAQIRRSQQRIHNLGFFDKVDVSTEKASAPDKANINVDVEERSTGELNFGAGFSTSEGALANASIRERNLLGRGQDLRFSVQKATKGFQTDISFTEPYFLDRDVAVGFDVFKITRDQESESSFDSDTVGGTLRATYSWTEHLRHTLKYSYRTDDITNIEPDASRFIKDQEGTNTTSLVGHVVSYDTRDDNFQPSTGWLVRFSQDVAGLGGDSEFFRNELRSDYFHPLYKDDVVLNLRARGGHIAGLNGKDVRINERFFIGGSDIRGFKNAGIGPRDSITRDALGGNLYYIGTAEVSFPLGLSDELGIRGAAFVDAGTLTEVDDTGPEVVDDDSIRASSGVGVAWASPLGPIRVDYAIPFMKENLDKEQQFRISFGTHF